MSVICNKQPILNKIDEHFSAFGVIFNKFFSSKDNKVNAMIILQKLKEKTIDPKVMKTFINSLPKDRWTVNIISEKIEEINNLFGMSNAEIKEHCVNNVTKTDIENIKWELVVQSMLDSSKFANEYYDSFKYNKNTKLSMSKMKLRNELMMVFKYIKESSIKIHDKFENAKYNQKNLTNFNMIRFAVELLWMRILYVLFHLENASDKKIEELTKILALERISLSHQKTVRPRYN